MSKYEQNPDQMWGSYDFVDHTHEVRRTQPHLKQSRFRGDYQFAPAAAKSFVPPDIKPGFGSDPQLQLPKLPDFSAIGKPVVYGNLQYLDQKVAGPLLRALVVTNFQPIKPDLVGTFPTSTRGTLVLMMPSSLTAASWAQEAIAKGSAVLVDLASLKTAVPQFEISSNPQYIAHHARPGGPLVVLGIAGNLDQVVQDLAKQITTDDSSSDWAKYAIMGTGALLVGGFLYAVVKAYKPYKPAQVTR